MKSHKQTIYMNKIFTTKIPEKAEKIFFTFIPVLLITPFYKK